MILLGIEWGSVADWFGAIGSILAIIASVIVVRFQLNVQRKLDREQYIFERQNTLLSDAEILSMTNLQILSEFDELIDEYKNSNIDKAGTIRKTLSDRSHKVVYNTRMIGIHISSFDANAGNKNVNVFDDLHDNLVDIVQKNNELKSLISLEKVPIYIELDVAEFENIINELKGNFMILETHISVLKMKIASA